MVTLLLTALAIVFFFVGVISLSMSIAAARDALSDAGDSKLYTFLSVGLLLAGSLSMAAGAVVVGGVW
ncbi:Uncharacterised protein [Nocardia farcinica]|uniref:hypothetical protein n=1 Tax=Nocardia farcinica TaxID=37329 RepID=UPI000E062D9D|nr:hypothetical protein [Nocardia farcinica]SUE29559.1 Uncharacterised protein [Nocardia farcinica]